MKKLMKVLVLVLLVGCSLCTHTHINECFDDCRCDVNINQRDFKDPTL